MQSETKKELMSHPTLRSQSSFKSDQSISHKKLLSQSGSEPIPVSDSGNLDSGNINSGNLDSGNLDKVQIILS